MEDLFQKEMVVIPEMEEGKFHLVSWTRDEVKQGKRVCNKHFTLRAGLCFGVARIVRTEKPDSVLTILILRLDCNRQGTQEIRALEENLSEDCFAMQNSRWLWVSVFSGKASAH